ncbi:MAG: hypothetical protein IMW90_08790 [Thermogemmatispora sp.]|uniref:hypothetical protein n=1 Tax=Thermogemmatispora TaxID=768669 RepID=UPI00124DDBC8|nr:MULTISPECIES: hypothetical protein [Thermogemmatispora]MBE3565808.1 hypothetical protein [Thermogemmatispora sp.]
MVYSGHLAICAVKGGGWQASRGYGTIDANQHESKDAGEALPPASTDQPSRLAGFAGLHTLTPPPLMAVARRHTP